MNPLKQPKEEVQESFGDSNMCVMSRNALQTSLMVLLQAVGNISKLADWRPLTSYRLSSTKFLDAGTGSQVTAFNFAQVGPGSQNFNGKRVSMKMPSFTMTSFQIARGQVSSLVEVLEWRHCHGGFVECPRPIKLRFYPTWSSRTRPSMRIQRSEGPGVEARLSAHLL